MNSGEIMVQSTKQLSAIQSVKQENERFREETGRSKKCLVHTYGCQMNEHDSEVLFGLLTEMGYVKTTLEEEADLILLNTCCIREKAESKVLSHLGEMRKLKQQNPQLIIGVCGCMTQQKGMAEKLHNSAPHVQLIFGTHNLHKLPEFIDHIFRENAAQYEVLEHELAIEEGLPVFREYPFKALVNIIYGCNNFCTYCIVPYVRGRERSRQIEQIVAEVQGLVEDGVTEITLLGQNVNSYGKDLQDGTNFAQLLERLNTLDGLKRIRFMTSHPKDLTDEMIAAIAKCNKVCRHIHLPVQSGSSRILKLMNRGYTKEDYLKLIDKIRLAIPDAAITTDIIVGFPGETEEDFLETVDLVQKVAFDSAFSFVYSKREGTPAARFADETTLEEKKERLQRLNEALSVYSKVINDRYLGQRVEVLVEGLSKNNDQMLSGKTESNKTVIFAGSPSLIGQYVDIEITDAQTWILKGTLLENKAQ